ncbi:MAG: flagellar hook-associated protein FlgK [Gammaproteobacteria bacterium]|nr:flagellar hook-associated protein FlgK [Gammaproteobacteria bacterium]
MTDLLNNGSNSLLAFQRALTTTSHNISNVNTEGYSRQRLELETIDPTLSNNRYVGSGVRAVGVERIHDQFAMAQILQSTSAHSQHSTHHAMASRIDNMVANDALSLTPVLNEFFNAIQDANSNPNSSASREVLVGTTKDVSSRIRALQLELDNTQEEVNQRTSLAVNEVNQLAADIASLNQQILSTGSSRFGNEPNDLLDRRDALLNQLSEYVDITRLDEDNGSVSVFMGNGVGLIVGTSVGELRTSANPLSSDLLKIEISQGQSWQNITTRLSGGSIGGLLEFENQTLKPSMNQLGLIALQFSHSMNTQHAQGIDSNGNAGTDLFSVSLPNVMADDQNTGTATLSSSFIDIPQVQATEYDIRFTGTDFTITRLSDQSTTNSGMPLSIDGMQLSITGTPAVGDTFRVSPVRRTAATMQSEINDANNLALSSPLRASGSIGNQSNAKIVMPTVNDIDNPALQDEITIQFSSDTSYDLIDSTSGAVLSAGIAYADGDAINFNGWQVSLDGSPTTGDEFSVLPNTTANGNNGNGLAMAALQLSPEMTGNATFNEGYSALVSRIGGQTRTLETRTAALDNIRLDAVERLQSVAGVNLDEEAINLTRFQQAYQASAQIISTADTLFQTLLGAVSR